MPKLDWRELAAIFAGATVLLGVDGTAHGVHRRAGSSAPTRECR